MKNGEAASGWGILQSETLCDTPHLRLNREFVATPSRPAGISWLVVHRRAAAVVAPRTPDGAYLLIRQERVAVRRELWEFPAGQIDGEVNERTIRETALRELGEETGMECGGELTPLGYFFSSPGFTGECAHLFLAADVGPRTEGPDHDEHEAILEVGTFSPEQLKELIAGGEIVDANTLAVFARLQARGIFS